MDVGGLKNISHNKTGTTGNNKTKKGFLPGHPPITCYRAATDSFSKTGNEGGQIEKFKPGKPPTCYAPMRSSDKGSQETEPVNNGITSQQKLNRLKLMEEKGNIK